MYSNSDGAKVKILKAIFKKGLLAFAMALATLTWEHPGWAAAAPPEMAQAEMLKGWFLIFDDLPATEKAKADLLYLINETPLEHLNNFKKVLENISPDFQQLHSITFSHLLPANLAVQSIIHQQN